MENSGQTRVWDVRTGRQLPGQSPDLPTLPDRNPSGISFRPGIIIGGASPFRSPDGRWLALEAGGVQLIDMSLPDASARASRLWVTRPDPAWHGDQAQRLTESGDGFA